MLITTLYVWPIDTVFFMGVGEGGNTAKLVEMTHRWIVADRIRLVFRFAAFLCLLKAMILSGATAIGH
jgi:hypothetical protein